MRFIAFRKMDTCVELELPAQFTEQSHQLFRAAPINDSVFFKGSFRKAGASAIPGLLVSLLRATPCYPKSNLQIEHSWKSWPFLRPVILPP